MGEKKNVLNFASQNGNKNPQELKKIHLCGGVAGVESSLFPLGGAGLDPSRPLGVEEEQPR